MEITNQLVVSFERVSVRLMNMRGAFKDVFPIEMGDVFFLSFLGECYNHPQGELVSKCINKNKNIAVKKPWG